MEKKPGCTLIADEMPTREILYPEGSFFLLEELIYIVLLVKVEDMSTNILGLFRQNVSPIVAKIQ